MTWPAEMAPVRPAVITMLGTPYSGKTTYLLAMYGTLSLGVGREAIVADANQDYLIAEDWDALCREGRLPPPTAEEPQEYRFTFTRDLDRVVVDLDWTDFRGGAMDARVPDDDHSADTARLIARLRRSDSIYLVLDGSQLAVTPSDGALAAAMLTRRMTSLVRSAIKGRLADGQPPPSLVALVTKADRIVGELWRDEDVWRAMNETTRRVRSLLPVLSEARVRALVCPVSLGHLREYQEGMLDPEDINPLWPEKPVLFTVTAHLDAEHDRWERERAAAEAEAGRLDAEWARAGWLERRRRHEIETAAAAARGRQAAAERAGRLARDWADLLRPTLRGTPVYFGGVPGMGVEHD